MRRHTYLNGLVVEKKSTRSYDHITVNLYNPNIDYIAATIELRFPRFDSPRVGASLRVIVEEVND